MIKKSENGTSGRNPWHDPAPGAAIEGGTRMFSLWKVLLPVTIGLGVVAYMFWRDARSENLMQVIEGVRFDLPAVFCIFMAVLCIVGRDFGLTWRLRILAGRGLSWRKALRVDMLCEFTSCVTPSTVGGSSFGMIFLGGEGVEFGRAVTLMMTTLLLDELFFVVSCPLAVLLSPAGGAFSSGDAAFSEGMRLTFWLVYAGIAVWTLVLFCGIILYPGWMRATLVKVTRLKWLRRWSHKARDLGDDMVATAAELRSRRAGFWLRSFGATSLSWVSRYLLVNALFMAFVTTDPTAQWAIFVRQAVMWTVLMVSPTPGGAGLSEWIFSSYYGDFVSTAGMALLLAVFWRLLSYYVYLVVGAIVVPVWVKNTYRRLTHRKDAASEETERKQNIHGHG